MKRIVLLLVCILTLCLCTGLLASCEFEDTDSTTYSVNTDLFDGVVALGEKPAIEDLVLVRSVMSTYDEIPVTEDMITAWGDYEAAGETNLIISFLGRRYQVPYVVKYKVDFVVEGETVKTQLVLNASEIEAPTPEKEGYAFAGWSVEIPEQLSANLRLEAVFEVAAPALGELSATYGDTLADLTLPQNANGSWQFTDALTTSVGAVGKNSFAVKFIQKETNEVLSEQTVSVNVEKATLTFENVLTEFIYNGSALFPTYTLAQDVEVITIGDAETNVGTYDFGFLINDPNYTGSYMGSFTIAKASAEIYVDSFIINAGEQIPTFSYRVEGFENTNNVLGVTITAPTVNGTGVFDIVASYNNNNVNVTVHNGTLTVNSTQLNVGAPILATTDIAYGDKLFDVLFASHPDGSWNWDTTKYTAQTTVGDVGQNRFDAVFTPNSALYEKMTYTVTITVAKKSISVVWSNLSFVYNGAEQVPTASASGLNGALVLSVSGAATNAGNHDATAALSAEDSACYMLVNATATFKIEKADNVDVVDAEQAAIFGDKLGSLALPSSPDGTWTFESGASALVGNVGTNTFVAKFTPSNKNYNERTVEVRVTVSPKSVTIVWDTEGIVYNGTEQAPVASAVGLNGVLDLAVSGATNAGTHTATATLADPNYTLTNPSVEFVIAPKSAKVDWSATTAVYDGTTKQPVAKIMGIGGEIVLTVSGSAINAGTYEATASVADSNYTLTNASIRFTIEKATASITTNDSYAFTYNGEEYTLSGISGSHGESVPYYTVEENGIAATLVNAGRYDVTVILPESSNYKMAQKQISVVINPTENTDVVDTEQSATYGDTLERLTLPTSEFGSWSFELGEEASVGDAGVNTFVAKFTSTNKNYSNRTVEIAVTVAKKTVETPIITEKEYNGEIQNSELTSNEIYLVIADEGGISWGTYTVTLKLADSANYKWKDSETDTLEVSYLIVKEKVNRWDVEPSIEGWTYGDTANEPTAQARYGDYTVSYREDVEGAQFTSQVPSKAGNYIARFETTDSSMVILVKDVSFTIAKRRVDVPTLETNSVVFTGAAFASGIEATAEYTVVGDGEIAVGTYNLILTLVDSANYRWNDSLSGVVRSYTYEITKATNAFTTELSIEGWMYGDTANAPEAMSAKFGNVVFKYSTSADGTYTVDVPTSAGSYYVKAFVEGNNNYTGLETEAVSFTIARKTVSVVWEGTSLTYNGKEQIPVATGEGVNGLLDLVISGGATNAGSYTAIASYDDDNYELVNASVEYTIARKAISVQFTNTTLVYNGAEQMPTVVLVGISGFDLDVTISGAATDAGNYTVTVSISEADAKNFELSGDSSCPFTIEQAMPTFNDFEIEGGPYYQDDIPMIPTDRATYEGAVMAGTYEVTSITFIDGDYSEYTITFTPADGKNFATVTATMYIKLVTVATIGHGGTPYGSIETAIAAAQSGDKIYVLPDISGNIVIRSNTTIPSGVTLILPWGAGENDYNQMQSNKFTATLYYDSAKNTYDTLNNLTNVTYVKLADGVTLTVNGTLTIAGELSGAAGGAPYTGHTAHYYAKLELGKNCQVLVNGIVHAFGFITEVQEGTARVQMNNGSSLYQPYVLRDARGGAQLKYISENGKGTTATFKRFIFMNVHPVVEYKYGSKLMMCANMYAQDQQNATMNEMVGNSSSSVFQIADGGSMTYDYDPYTEVSDIHFYGGMTVNALKISVTFIVTLSLDTSEFLFGFGYHWNTFFHPGENGESAVYDFSKQALQILPDANLTVYEGAHLKFGKAIVLDDTYIDAAVTRPYPRVNEITGSPLAAANVIIYGTMEAEAFGGVVHTDDLSKISIATKSFYCRDIYYAVRGSGLNTLNVTGTMQPTRTEIAYVESNGRIYAWVDGALTDVTDQLCYVTISVNGGSGTTQTIRVIKGQTFKLPSDAQMDGKDFDAWSSNGTTYAAGASVTVTDNVTFTAQWKDASSSGGSGSCVTPDTLITLADGTQVRVDSLTGNEELLVWNMETGTFDKAYIMFVDFDAAVEVEVITLHFSDGTTVKVITEHGFWDYDLNRYVYLDENAAEYIGHTFAKQSGDALEKVQLVDVTIATVLTEAWSPVTVGHLCYFVNGMLSMPGGVGGLFNIFEVDPETMTYDYEAIARDIEIYGLYTYEELNALCPLSREMFEAAGGAYLKISIAKGNLSEEELFTMIRRYSKFF